MDLGWLLMALGLAALTFAIVLGGREERIFVLVQAASGIAERGVVHFEHDIFRAVLVDLAVLAALLPLALRSRTTWPLVVASLCVASLMTEAAQFLVHAGPMAYAITQGGWDLLADLVVAIGAWKAWQAQLRPGSSAGLDTKTPDPG